METPVPKGSGFWFSLENRPPVRPHWGRVRTALINSTEGFLPRAPPRLRSRTLKRALQEVREKTQNLNAERRMVIATWADSIGTHTPTGHWNQIACDLLARSGASDFRSARVLAVMNLAMFDAGIVCWGCKYRHWTARPSQLDSRIKTLIKVPNFPAYMSGHSTFSGAAEVLAHFFPAESGTVRRMAEQASLSRVLCGLHFRFDCEAGLRAGRRVGRRALRVAARSPYSIGR